MGTFDTFNCSVGRIGGMSAGPDGCIYALEKVRGTFPVKTQGLNLTAVTMGFGESGLMGFACHTRGRKASSTNRSHMCAWPRSLCPWDQPGQKASRSIGSAVSGDNGCDDNESSDRDDFDQSV
jgi:hypothetical protein